MLSNLFFPWFPQNTFISTQPQREIRESKNKFVHFYKTLKEWHLNESDAEIDSFKFSLELLQE